MPSPFPGMDPYLENVELWTAVHATFIAQTQDHLSEALWPRYIVRFEERVYITDDDDPAYRLVYPDVKVVATRPLTRPGPPPESTAGGLAIAEPISVVEVVAESLERRVEIRDPADQSVVTVIELLSPTNKTSGSRGRESFLRKRREVYESTTHWMEIDLLRGGDRTANRSPSAGTAYQSFLSRWDDRRGRRLGYLWPMPLRQRLPVVGVPLRPGEADQPLDLQAVLDRVYRRNAYELQFDYAGEPPSPALSVGDSAWCRDRVATWRAGSQA